MAQRVTLAKDLASGSDAASVRIRSSQRPYLVASDAGYTGNVTIEHTVDGPDVTDASASWDSLGTLGANDAITIDHPIYRIRVGGDHSTGTATVYLVESVNR